MTTGEKRPLTAEDLYQFKLVTDPQISPDGRHVLFGVVRIDKEKEKRFTNLWIAAADSSTPPRQYTYGDQTDTGARWSPDGEQIAFLSNRQDEKQMQLYLLHLHGGEGRPLTSMEGSFGGFAWSPLGDQIVCQFRKKDPAAIEREKDEQKKKLGIVSRHITDLNYKLDGVGYLPQEKWHIWTVDAATGEGTQLSDGPFNETEPIYSPDGRQILFASNRHPQEDLNPDATELYLLPAAGGEMSQVQIENGGFRKYLPVFSPDGEWIAYMSRPEEGRFFQNAHLYIVPVAGGAAINLSAESDLHLATSTLTDSGTGVAQTPPTWSADGAQIFIQATEQANQPLLAFAADGSGFERIITDPGLVGSFSLDASNERLAYLWGNTKLAGQAWVRELPRGEARALTYFNTEWFATISWGDLEELWFDGPEGNKLHGWILKPPGFDPAQKYPSILEIHGGPYTQYGRAFMHEFHFLAANGYVVYFSNPRGSQGYGQAHAAAIANRWGTVDYEDVMAWVDYMEKQPYIDPERMGVTGGSYGGYMTTLIIGKTDRFKAAVAQRVVSNLVSFHGSSDMNWMVRNLTGIPSDPWNDLSNYWRQSPMATIGNAKTPTLILHSERDLRCDREQGEQVFAALRRLGVETELVLFPEESHGLSRIGRTDRRISRLQHMLRWFDKYLKP